METRKKWQFFLILAVVGLTIYNILPTLFYYTKPLNKQINQHLSQKVTKGITQRVNDLEKKSVEWIHSFCHLLKIKPASVIIDEENSQQIIVRFSKDAEAKTFRNHLPRAGALISFHPSQLTLGEKDFEDNPKTVYVKRNIPIHFDENKNYFTFSPKRTSEGPPTEIYQEITLDRVAQLGVSIGGISDSGLLLTSILETPDSSVREELLSTLANNILSYVDAFDENSSITKRFFASFSQSYLAKDSAKNLIHEFEKLRDDLKIRRIHLQEKEKELKQNDSYMTEEDLSQLHLLQRKETTFLKAETLLRKHQGSFEKGENPWDYKDVFSSLQKTTSLESDTTQLKIGDRNPFISKVLLDWNNEQIHLLLHNDISYYFDKHQNNSLKKNQLEQLLINEIARISRTCGENINPQGSLFTIELNHLTNSSSILTMDLAEVARIQAKQIQKVIQESWNPKHSELASDVFPLFDYDTYSKLPYDQKNLGLVIYAPSTDKTEPPQGMRSNSIYIIAKGIQRILEKYQMDPNSVEAREFLQDFYSLREILSQNGYLGYLGSAFPTAKEFHNDFIFEKDDYFQTLLNATRENFTVHGSKKFAVLEFTDVEQRILALNKIDTMMHEDLLKARDDYNAAQVSIEPQKKYDAPKPTQNTFLNNLYLSFTKYFRGDERKILHWGLDLSGGKTVTIELRDQAGKPVKDEADLHQGINELYNRVNKMGVSEVNIHLEGSNIVLDFPGSQNLSAAELIKASSMYFHIVNEKFSQNNPHLTASVNQFLQEIWNEATVTNKKDAESVNAIAWKHLYGDTLESDIAQPRSESAKILYAQGLRLSSSTDTTISSVFNDSISKIAVLRGDDFTKWQEQTHPLMIVFQNHSLEGSHLTNVRSGYDPSKGNILSFEIKGSHTTKEGQKLSPREDLYAWTSQFSKENVLGTPNGDYSSGRGWRMCAILNGSVISSPTLDSALKESAMITGNFSQREINQLVADLKAGSLSYTPKILSEKNVSPELGSLDRAKGIAAAAIALLLVVIAMIGYYRFAGLIASVAVVLNLLIMWATLQNLHATLTLAGIAGIILTMGMAVDANVLIFERIREEFSVTKRLSSAIHAGYKKAFSAILDSNVTTIIAGLILLNFDSGPIKAFAITLIIGIASSMFTALFLTRFFFAGWVQNAKNKSLTMMNFVKSSNFNFLKRGKLAFMISAVIIVLGSFMLYTQKSSIFGMDFTGGYALNVELEQTQNINYRQKVEKALTNAGASFQDFQVRELNPSNHLRILLGVGMNQIAKPFYEMPEQTDQADVTYLYENNPRVTWIVNALEKEGLKIEPRNLSTLESNWTSMSGQMSDSMRNNAIYGLLLAFAAILIYITFRFEFKYAISAMLCLFHDVLISISAIGLLHWMGISLQIDLQTVAAIMTIIGYSLNDTIIVFDRIREDAHTIRKRPFTEIINNSLNITLSRTTITSATTLLVLLALVFLGGTSIFSFALVMTLGVIFGTLSSLFIASPLMLLFHKKETQEQGYLKLSPKPKKN